MYKLYISIKPGGFILGVVYDIRPTWQVQGGGTTSYGANSRQEANLLGEATFREDRYHTMHIFLELNHESRFIVQKGARIFSIVAIVFQSWPTVCVVGGQRGTMAQGDSPAVHSSGLGNG